MTQMVQHSPGGIMEQVITKGDLSKLSDVERWQYYVAVCDSIGVNPLTKPFEYINLSGKLTLYALKNCTDQLRMSRGVSVEEMTENRTGDIYVVTCKVRDKEGRTDAAKGAVSLTNLSGLELANAIMRAETKAKRRATLSICGLSMLDESEDAEDAIPIRHIAPHRPQAAPLPPHDAETGEVWETVEPHEIELTETSAGPNWVAWGSAFVAQLQHAEDEPTLSAWIIANGDRLNACEEQARKVYERLQAQMRMARDRMQPDLIDAEPEKVS